MAEWFGSWHRLRRIGRDRDWMTWAEFDGLLRQCGIFLTPYHVRLALADDPPAKEYGSKRYMKHHVGLAASYARSRGLTNEGSRDAIR